jgi:hypothetical protein
MRKIVQVQETSYGLFLPTMIWGQGESMDREAFWDSFNNLADAERSAKLWAEERGAEYVPFRPIDREAINREVALIRKLREEEGLDLRTAIQRAREQLGSKKG